MRRSSPSRYSVSTVSSVRQTIRSYIVPSESDDMHRRHRAQITNALIADSETPTLSKMQSSFQNRHAVAGNAKLIRFFPSVGREEPKSGRNDDPQINVRA